MAKKTAFRRLTKWLPLVAEAAEAVDHDTRREFGQDAFDVTPAPAQPAAQEAPKSLAARVLAAPAKKTKAPKKAEPTPQEDTYDAHDLDGV